MQTIPSTEPTLEEVDASHLETNLADLTSCREALRGLEQELQSTRDLMTRLRLSERIRDLQVQIVKLELHVYRGAHFAGSEGAEVPVEGIRAAALAAVSIDPRTQTSSNPGRAVYGIGTYSD